MNATLRRRLLATRDQLERRAQASGRLAGVAPDLRELCQGLPSWALEILARPDPRIEALTDEELDRLLAEGIDDEISRGNLERTPAGEWQPAQGTGHPELMQALSTILNCGESRQNQTMEVVG